MGKTGQLGARTNLFVLAVIILASFALLAANGGSKGRKEETSSVSAIVDTLREGGEKEPLPDDLEGTINIPLSRAVNANVGMDFTPGGGGQGGNFEDGNDHHPGDLSLFHKNGWITQESITQDDFDDTEDVPNSWTANEGIYSRVRRDEDLNDGTLGVDGAWCVQAGENGGIVVSEDSRGYALCYRWFDLDDYIYWDDYTITGARVWIDYMISSGDFNHNNNYVILNAFIGDGNDNPMLKHFKTSSDPLAYYGGKCLDFWDVDDPASNVNNPTVSVNNKLLDTLSGGANLPNFFNTHAQNSREFVLIFQLQTRLYGAWPYNFEYFKFWLDDVWISLDYTATDLATTVSANTAEGYAPFDVTFSSSTEGGLSPYSYRWNFGDGGTSQSVNPSHRFNNPGTYNVQLTVTDDQARTDSDIKTIVVHAKPTASIDTVSPSPATATERVSFKGSMSGGWGPMSMADWNFGDGSTTTGEAPNHVYTTHGTFTVKFKAKDSHNTDTPWVNYQITINRKPSAAISDISLNPATVGVPIDFAGTGTHGTGSLSYEWDFGDSKTSSSRTPTHTYSTSGTYTASFRAKDSHNVWSAPATSAVVVNQVPQATIVSVRENPATATEVISFSGSGSRGTGSLSYLWDFDDGSSSSTQNPTHAYTLKGTYSVKLKVKDSLDVWSPVASVSVTVNELPSAEISSIAPAPATLTEPIKLIGTGSDGTGGIIEYHWDLGDTSTSNVQNPIHIYGQSGTYTVTLKVKDSHNIWSETVSGTVLINPLPVGEITAITPNPATVGIAVSFSGSGSGGTGGINDFLWDFGDDNVDDAANVDHAYIKEKTYTVTFKVKDSHDVWSEPITRKLEINPVPLAILGSVSINPATVSEAIQFSGSGTRGTGGIVEFQWDFGDDTGDQSSSPSHEYEEAGTYHVSFKVRDVLGIWSAPTTVDININLLPTASINSISPSSTTQGGQVSFSGGGSGGTGGITEYKWQSSIDGYLSDEADFSTSTLSVGIHTIYLECRDSHGIWGVSDSSVFIVKADPGAATAKIESISPGECGYGEKVSFEGSANGGSGTYIKYMWRSDIDGFISGKASFTANNLSVGDHIIYFKVQDSKDRWSSEVTGSVTILMDDDAPLAEIISIAPSPAYSGEAVSFMGKGSGGTGIFIEFRWRSDRDGLLSDRDTFTSSSLSPGRHIIYYSVRDSASLWSAEDGSELQIMDSDTAPVATIENIHPNPSEQDGEVTFIGRGEARTGEIVEYIWTSDIDGELSRSASFKISSLSVGHHIIGLQVKDSGARLSPPFQSLLVVDGKEGAPVARIELIEPVPATEDDEITFRGRGSGGSGQYSEYSWRSTLEGFLSDDPEFEKTLSAGEHIIYFKLKDSHGLWSSEISFELTVISSKNRLTAHLMVTPATLVVGEPVSFSSINHSGEVEEFLFVFGNGDTTEWITQEETTYIYTQAGRYIARLQLKDADEKTGDFILLEVTVEEKKMSESVDGNISSQFSDWYYYLLGGFGIALLLIIALLLVVSRRKSRKQSIIEDLEPREVKIDYSQQRAKPSSDETGRVAPPVLSAGKVLVSMKPDKLMDLPKKVVPKFPESYDHIVVPKAPKLEILMPEKADAEPDSSYVGDPSEEIKGKLPAEFHFQAHEPKEIDYSNIQGKEPDLSDSEVPGGKSEKKLPKIIREVKPGDGKGRKSKGPRIVRELKSESKKGKKAPRIVASTSGKGTPPGLSESKKQVPIKQLSGDRVKESERVDEHRVLTGKTRERLDFLINKFQNSVHDEGSEPIKKGETTGDLAQADKVAASSEDPGIEGDASRAARSWFDDLKSRHGDAAVEADDEIPELIPE